MNVTVTKKQKKNYLIYKDNNKFANQLDLTPKEINIKDKAIEAAKTSRNEQKHKEKSIKNTWEQNLLHG